MGRHTKFLGSSVGLEHLTVNQRVRGSNPRRGANKYLDGGMVDALVLETSIERCVGSNPAIPTEEETVINS